MSRYVDTIVAHYSATYETQDIGLEEIRAMHKARGWSREGYHEIIRLDGTLEHGRPWDMLGAGVLGQNTGKLHVCAIGGLRKGVSHGLDTRTPAQKEKQIEVINSMLRKYPKARVVGHNELAATECPGIVFSQWWAEVKKGNAPVMNPVEKGGTTERPYLTVGRSGKEVRLLKAALQKLGVHELPVTSDWFGQYTAEQVMRYQQKLRDEGHDEVLVDGKVGSVTWSYIIQQGGLKGLI